MIRLTRLNHGLFMLNPDLIEHLEMTPDTVVTLTNGHQFMVRESADEVVERIVEFRRTVNAHCLITRIAEPAAPTGGDEA
ncbi:MAG: flagellar FlbD family protein [Bryobacteraceae bacterium]